MLLLLGCRRSLDGQLWLLNMWIGKSIAFWPFAFLELRLGLNNLHLRAERLGIVLLVSLEGLAWEAIYRVWLANDDNRDKGAWLLSWWFACRGRTKTFLSFAWEYGWRQHGGFSDGILGWIVVSDGVGMVNRLVGFVLEWSQIVQIPCILPWWRIV